MRRGRAAHAQEWEAVTDVDERDALYALDPSEFVAARDQLVRAMKADGRRNEAEEVARLRRPSASAGALNQVAREQPEVVAEAVAAGRRLRNATGAAMDGDASQLRGASAAQRQAADALVGAALRRLGGGGPAVRQKLAATVHAAVVDDEVAEALTRGTLTTDEERPGLGLAGAGPVGGGDGGTSIAPGAKRTKASTSKKAGRAKSKAKAPPARSKRTTTTAGRTKPFRAERQPREVDTAQDRERRTAAAARRKEIARLRAEAQRTAKRAQRLARDAARAERAAIDARTAADEAAREASAAADALAAARADG